MNCRHKTQKETPMTKRIFNQGWPTSLRRGMLVMVASAGIAGGMLVGGLPASAHQPQSQPMIPLFPCCSVGGTATSAAQSGSNFNTNTGTAINFGNVTQTTGNATSAAQANGSGWLWGMGGNATSAAQSGSNFNTNSGTEINFGDRKST